MVKKVGKYEIGKTIGEGTFGKVKLAVNTETGEKMAIKVRATRRQFAGRFQSWGCGSILKYVPNMRTMP